MTEERNPDLTASRTEIITHPLSAHQGEIGYDLFDSLSVLGKTIRVTLDGVEIHEVISTDPERGTLVRYVTDEKGDITLNASREEALTETLTGQVIVEAYNA
jgi:hypothetical protein